MNQEPEIPAWIMTLIALSFFGGLGALAFFINYRRGIGFERLAERYGMTYYDAADESVALPPEFIEEVESGIIVETGIRRALTGDVDGIGVRVCELLRYRQRSSGGLRGHYTLGVVSFDLSELNLPSFSLQPEKLRHKLVELTRLSDIDFADSPRFSRRYLLRGEDEKAIREAFHPPLRDFLGRRPGRCIRSYSGRIVYYRPVRLLRWSVFRPRAVERLLKEASELVRLLDRSNHEPGA